MAAYQPDRPVDGEPEDLHIVSAADDDDVQGHVMIMLDQEPRERRDERPF